MTDMAPLYVEYILRKYESMIAWLQDEYEVNNYSLTLIYSLKKRPVSRAIKLIAYIKRNISEYKIIYLLNTCK